MLPGKAKWDRTAARTGLSSNPTWVTYRCGQTERDGGDSRTGSSCIVTRVKCRLGRTGGRGVALEPVKNNSCLVLSNADGAIT